MRGRGRGDRSVGLSSGLFTAGPEKVFDDIMATIRGIVKITLKINSNARVFFGLTFDAHDQAVAFAETVAADIRLQADDRWRGFDINRAIVFKSPFADLFYITLSYYQMQALRDVSTTVKTLRLPDLRNLGGDVFLDARYEVPVRDRSSASAAVHRPSTGAFAGHASGDREESGWGHTDTVSDRPKMGWGSGYPHPQHQDAGVEGGWDSGDRRDDEAHDPDYFDLDTRPGLEDASDPDTKTVERDPRREELGNPYIELLINARDYSDMEEFLQVSRKIWILRIGKYKSGGTQSCKQYCEHEELENCTTILAFGFPPDDWGKNKFEETCRSAWDNAKKLRCAQSHTSYACDAGAAAGAAGPGFWDQSKRPESGSDQPHGAEAPPEHQNAFDW